MITPSLKPIHLQEFTCKQGHYGDPVPKLPMRSMLVGPSGSGKTVLLTNMILDICKSCFQEFIFGHQVSLLTKHGNQSRITFEIQLSQTTEKTNILIVTTRQNLNNILQPNRKS